jgi:uncharacterized protein DUF6777/protein kinase-like protein
MVPERFGPYQIQELIGRGGMGEVHRAFDTVRQRTVALKRLRPEFAADERFRTRFLRECRLAAQLTEAHVIPIHDFGEIDGRLYLDMRLVHGSNLEEVLATGGPLTPDRAVGVVTQVAAALDAAHAAGLVHRDVKPSNVLLSTDGPGLHCYLADFGVAAAVGGSGSLTSTGTTVGTMAYIAPERLRGEPADHRVDVYSLACLLHEALTGQPPFRSDELAAVIRAHLELEPPRASSLVPTVPPALDEVVARGMAKDPALRHQTAGELAAAANAALSGRMIGPPAAPATVAAAVPDAAVTAGPRHAPRTPAAARRRRGRLVPRLALVGLLLLAIAVVTIGTRMLTSVEVMRVTAEPASSPGGDPFAPADTGTSPSAPPPAPPAPAQSTGATQSSGDEDPGGGQPAGPASTTPVSGDTAGLYGGTGSQTCDPDRMATLLEAHPDRAAAWAHAQGIDRSQIRPFLMSLTPVVLRVDTAITNHGYRNGQANAFQSVLQAGTAVLVDGHGVPRVRCACGNPLQPPAARPRPRYQGAVWPTLRSERVTVVQPAPTVIQHFVIVNAQADGVQVVVRPAGSSGAEDRPAPPEQAAQALHPTFAATSTDESPEGSSDAGGRTSTSNRSATSAASVSVAGASTPPSPSGSPGEDTTSTGSATSTASASTGSGTSTENSATAAVSPSREYTSPSTPGTATDSTTAGDTASAGSSPLSDSAPPPPATTKAPPPPATTTKAPPTATSSKSSAPES